MTTYDAVFFISVGTITSGLIAIMIKYCLKSKCEHFSLCFGLIKIDRRVDLEVQEEMHALELGVNDTSKLNKMMGVLGDEFTAKLNKKDDKITSISLEDGDTEMQFVTADLRDRKSTRLNSSHT